MGWRRHRGRTPAGGVSITALCDTRPPLFLDIPGAAKLLGLSRGMVYRLIQEGELTSIQIASRRYIARSAIDEFVSKRTTPTSV
jgi:excisionase family DNA binding protein